MNFTEVLFNSISSAVVVVDDQLLIKKFNEGFSKLFGSGYDFTGQPLGNSMGCFTSTNKRIECGKDESCLTCRIRSSVNNVWLEFINSEPFKITEIFDVEGKQSKMHLLINVKPLIFEDRELAMVIIDDITDIEETRLQEEILNQKLRDMIKKKNEFLGIAAHDLRNPLSLIQSATNYIIDRKDSVDPATYKKLMDSILQTSNFSLELINELLDVSAIETGELNVVTQPVDYNTMVQESIELNSITAYKKGISISVVNEDPVPDIMIDKGKIKQVLNNLLSNAIKYSYPFTHIKVEIVIENFFVVTKVRDEGQGIPEEEQENIFEAFKKTSVQSTAGEKSTGLGLKIVKEIIKGHGGEIKLTSSPGEGSEFSFTIPYKNM